MQLVWCYYSTMIEVTLIGTGATMPLPDRACSSVLIKHEGRTILIDCGEGTQSAARRAKVSLMKTDIIALTHYHGDHLFGLPGLMQSFACMGRTDPLYICGPEGIEVALEPIMTLAGPLPFKVYMNIGALNGIEIGDAVLKAFKVNHRVPAYGYEFTLSRAGKFDPKKADALGVPLASRATLQHGESVEVGSMLVTPDMVMGQMRKGLKVVVSGDTSPCRELTAHAKDADLFICDATYGENAYREDAVKYGHSTFADAAATAKNAECRRLWLTHFSQMMEFPEEFLENATDIFPDAVCGQDGMNITLKFED